MKLLSQNLKRLFVAALVGFLTFSSLFGQSNLFGGGALDWSFGSGGKVLTNFEDGNDGANDAVVQPDGKIIVVGSANNASLGTDIFVVRYNPNGTLDSTFGAAGRVITPFGGLTAVARGTALQSDGKIVVGGSTINPSTGLYNRVALRYSPNGTLDTTFGANGIATITGLNALRTDQCDVAIQPDGKILLAGSIQLSRGAPEQFSVLRLNPNGTLDNTFDTDGRVNTAFSGFDNGFDMKLLEGGKILIAGNAGNFTQFALARYNANGSLDTTFDGDGKVTTSFSVPAAGFRAAIQPDGKYLMVGGTRTVPTDYALARYNPDGSLDATFGASGRLLLDVVASSGDTGNSIWFRNGKIVVAGNSVINGINTKFSMMQLLPDGTPDPGFGLNGRVLTDFGDSTDTASHAILQPDGKLLQFGSATDIFNNSRDVALARYNLNSKAAQYDFDGDGRDDAGVYRAGTWYINRTTQGFLGFQFGAPSDKITPADFDGDGKTDIAVWREAESENGVFYIVQSATSTFRSENFGQAGDIPAAGDWDGDGRADAAVYRSAGGFFRYRPSTAPQTVANLQWGVSGDEPVRGDFDGDGKLDAAVFRPSIQSWLILQSSDNQFRGESWGIASDKRVSGDFDGDSKTDLAVFRGGNWYIRNSSNNGFRAVQWGAAGDKPVAGDYDGDGLTDIGVFRDGTWYIFGSQTGFTSQSFGAAGDVPIPAHHLP